jgi:putative nucleotidyltransferase with HDIG domain
MIGKRPTGLDVYIAAIVFAGATLLVWSAAGLSSTPHAREWGILAGLALVASRFPLRMPGRNGWFSISDTFFMASAILFGSGPATLTIAIDSALMTRSFKTFSLRRLLFNAGASSLALWGGWQAFKLLAGAQPLFGLGITIDALVVPVVGFALVYYVLNAGLISIAVGLDKHLSPFTVWRSNFLMIAVNYFAAGSIALLVVVLTQYFSITALIAVLPLLAIISVATKSWTGRIEDAEKHVAVVDGLYLSTIGALSTAIEAKDGVTSSHIHRVQHYAMGLAKAIGNLDEPTLKALEAAALLHDTGKLAVPERILNKPGKLTPAEFETMKLHVEAGADILSSIDFPYPVVPIVRAHHENWDGTGYPNGLKGVQIPIGARILSVVDCYDALTSDRPYRGAMTDEEALEIIRARRGTMYDPIVVDMFERVCRDIGPMAVKPQMQKAIHQINRSATEMMAPAPAPPPPGPSAAVAEGPDSLRALANLARIVSGRPTATDVASMIWAHVRHIVPNASCAFFVNEPARDAVSVKFVAGEGSTALQGLEIKLGDRLTGWVAENQQAIVNSEAKLDLGAEAAFVGLHVCLSLPLVSEGRLAGVLSLYGREAFSAEQVHTLQDVLPHLAVMFLALESRADAAPVVQARQPLRVVASR